MVAILTLTTGCGSTRRNDSEMITLAIVGTNDLHGTLAPDILDSKEPPGQPPSKYSLGGASILSAYVNVLRRENPGRLLWLDAGDEFQGALESNSEEGAPVVRFFNAAGLDAATIGNHEFDFGSGKDGEGDPRAALKERIREAHYPFVSTNIVSRSSGARALPAPPSVLLNVAGIRVGVMGLTTVTTPVTTWPPYVADLSFPHLAPSTAREAARLRSKGAEIVLLLAHVGLNCGPPTTPLRLWSPSDPQPPCGTEDELVRLLTALPAGTVDAVVSGHSHSVVHHWIAGVPVVQGEWKGHFLNVVYLPFDRRSRTIARDDIRIEGPVRICETVFSRQGDCDGSAAPPAQGRGGLVPALFHGRTIVPDESITKLLAPTFARVSALKARVIARAEQPLRRSHSGEAEMGNLVTDAMRRVTGADVAMLNAGGIRAELRAGPITYGDVFAALPFENRVVVLHLTGRELRSLVRVAESGALGYFPLSGLRVMLSDCGERCPTDDLDGDGRIAAWERNHVIRIETDAGRPLEDERSYRVATNDFIVAGGDFMAWPVSRIPADHIEQTPVCQHRVRQLAEGN